MRTRIEKLVYGGEGLAHAGGDTLFIPFVIPGEEVDAEIVERKRKLARGRVQQLLSASPDRVSPQCPHFGVCGGCDYQHISYEAQLQAKETILRETLRRIGGIDWKDPITLHKSPPWAYRNRAQWKVRPVATQQSAKPTAATIGYLRPRSAELCPVQTCSIISPQLLTTFQALRSALTDGRLPANAREIEAFVDARDKELLLNVTCSTLPRPPESLLSAFKEVVPAASSILVQDATASKMALHGPGFLHYDVFHQRFRVGHLSFFQVNRFLVGEMATTASNLAGRGELAFDLFAGVGLFSALLAQNFSRVIAVEADPASARDLKSLASSGAKTIVCRNQPAAPFLSEWARGREADKPEVVVVDPPRAGLDDAVVAQLLGLKPQRLIYISCDPSTLARDLARLCAQEYTLRDIHLFDMFPQTYHIESVGFLERAR